MSNSEIIISDISKPHILLLVNVSAKRRDMSMIKYFQEKIQDNLFSDLLIVFSVLSWNEIHTNGICTVHVDVTSNI